MADTAAWLVDEVIPHVPVRQWVLSVPWRVRFALAKDAKLLTKALAIFIAELFRDVRRRTKPAGPGRRRPVQGGLALRSANPGREAGAVTGVQRFGGAINLNVHFHTLTLDGVFESGQFREAPKPTDEDVRRVLVRVRSRIERMLVKAGITEEEPTEAAEPMDLFQAASIQGMVAMSEEVRGVTVVGGNSEKASERKPRRLCAEKKGYSLHAAVRMKANDRTGLEILCRYVLRPSYSQDRMTELPDGRIQYEFRREWENGSSHVILTPMELMEKLSALIPPPRYHLVRYHGVLAPRAKRRKEVVKKTAGAVCEHAGGGPDETSPLVAVVGGVAKPREPAPRERSESRGPDGETPLSTLPAELPVAEPSSIESREPAGDLAPNRIDREPLAAMSDVGSEAAEPSPPGLTESAPERAGPEADDPMTSLPTRAFAGEPPKSESRELAETCPAETASPPEAERPRRERRRRLAWAELMRRTMDLDVLACPKCGERMKVIAWIEKPEVVEKFLRAVGLWEEPSPLAPSRAGPDDGLEWDHLE